MTTTPTPASQPSPLTAEHAQIYREAIAQVCEGWTLPPSARKVLETALWAEPSPARSDKDADIIAAFEREISSDPEAFNRPGEVVYSITQEEMLRFAKGIPAQAQESAPSSEPTDAELLTLAAEQDYAEEDPKCILRLMRATIALARRATAGTTAPARQNWELVVARPEQIRDGSAEPETREMAMQALVCAQAVAGTTAAPSQSEYERGFIDGQEKIDVIRRKLNSAEAEIESLRATAGNAAPGDLPQVGAHAWFHRGMANFDAEEVLATLDDGKGTPIPLYIASNAGAAPSIPEGLAIVPKIPTQAMLDNIAAFVDHNEDDASIIYRAMLAAAPSNPPVGEKEKGL